MNERIENNLINSYKYIDTELSVYDTDQDGEISVFEIEQIEDEETQTALLDTLETSKRKAEVTDENIQALESQLSTVKSEQGIFSKAWNWVKCTTGIGSSTEKCSDAIEDYKNGKITLEEAQEKISEFSTKQKNSVNLVANVATGVVAVLAVGSAVLTGGMSLAVGAAIGAAAGAGTKAGLKFLDRATNQVEGDALDGKQIAKDALSGAVDGAISVATMGIGSTALAGKTVAEQTLKNTIIQGAKYGAIDGAISGSVTGAADYTIEAALEEDVDFELDEFAKSTLSNAAGGALAGGVLGGASAGIGFKKGASTADTPEAKVELDKPEAKLEVEETPVATDTPETNVIVESEKATIKTEAGESATAKPVKEKPKYLDKELREKTNANLSKQAEELEALYASHLGEAEDQIKASFENLSTVKEVTARSKGSDSIFAKLANKYKKGKLKTTSQRDCLEAIGDAYGTRVQLKSLTPEKSKEVIEDCLQGYDVSYEQFIKYINGDTKSLDKATIETIEEVKDSVIDLLKETQTGDVVRKLIQDIEDGTITITELNNYGNKLSSYFTDSQLQDIAQAYYLKTNERLKIVTQNDFTKTSNVEFGLDDTLSYTVDLDTNGAVKDSGYASSQMNTKHIFKDGKVGNGELQIRGVDLNKFADVEHIPYDIRKGKITAQNTKYKEVFDIIDGMSDKTYDAYIKYLNDVYEHLRLKELGIETPMPNIDKALQGTASGLRKPELRLIGYEGLLKYSKH